VGVRLRGRSRGPPPPEWHPAEGVVPTCETVAVGGVARELSNVARCIDGLHVPASVHDVDGRFVHLNAAAERASGRSREYWLGRTYTDPLPADTRASVIAHFRRAVEEGKPTDFETVFVDAVGIRRNVRAQQLPVWSGDTIVGVLILAFDARGGPSPLGGSAPPGLTPRQREILELIDAGLSTVEIAERLTLSVETVRNHVRSLLTVLGAHTRLEAVVAARRLGLLAAPGLQPYDAR
jgi:PAS domain S-box-containing protein